MGEVTTSFRDHITTVTEDGKKRKWIYPKLIKGKLYRYRNYFGWALLALLFSGPFIKVNGEQLILFNIIERKFAFFGVIFSPHDFYLFVLGMLIFVVFIVLFTVVFGRVWCGWACPQTIFMEIVFRRIERWIEGNAQQQKKLDESPLSLEKLGKKTLKHSIFIFISFLISNIFLAYIIGSDSLITIISEPVSQHVAGFISICLFTAVFYLVFARMRELVCIVACPYGRLQGVLLDNHSMIVAYDYKRGEPRGKRKRNSPLFDPASQVATGDCVDCDLCVQVCPTGIDIRNGTQLECINCTLCIDACDMVMKKINRPQRLIGFMSEDQITSRNTFKPGKRLYSYAAVLLVMISVLAVLLVRRTDIETTVLRAGGTIYQLRDDGTVSNLYNAEFVNNTNQPIAFQIKPAEDGTRIQFIRQENRVEKGASTKMTFFVIRPQKAIKAYKSDIELDVISEGVLLDKIETTFIAPPNF
ncbi:cytochrome c oxidase accessory protein FixG [Arcticibacter tournemirensis]|uniref:Cytochrome c oxidase accessory protein CcoG n=1 Tax=Arcticibacter tournemirensis TaxID=699437 RepID=A0A5M9HJD9_9SPHI|nr:cytochrome c oxidase accessory protein CcoG [Arcticibacter tournemirensis]KAA8486649.1 cytochrome c oxidase accessory protein CcoG [Arcticibacter tournemirensis]TQM49175.1 cytochrome c oxidase accessory protein FixG [Arcticibacter tournemirensis]